MLPLVFSLPVMNAFWPFSWEDHDISTRHSWWWYGVSHLSRCYVRQTFVRENKSYIRLGFGAAFVHGSRLLQVDRPRCCLLGVVGYLEFEDAIGLEREAWSTPVAPE